MCGIVGIITKNKYGFGHNEGKLFTNMLQMDSIRGEDSTGVFGVDSTGKIDLIKGDTNGWQFTKCKNYTDFESRIFSTYQIVIGHNRAATKGSITPENAHPFKEDNIILVHNGTIFNQDELDKSVEVDSHAITKALAKADAKTALNQIHGPFALVWFDSTLKTLNLARNDDRPLFLVEYQTFWTISSEPGLPVWLNGRNGTKFTKTPIIIPTEKIISFNLDNLSNGYTELEFENYAVPIQYNQSYSHHYVPPQIRNLHTVPKSIDHSFTQGDTIDFKIDDIKHEPGDVNYVIFGFPVLNKEIDENILVKSTCTDRKTIDELRISQFGTGHITSISSIGKMTLLLVQFAQTKHMDANKNSTTEDDIKLAIANGCNKCKGIMNFVDIADSIIRKKKDGSFRTLCKKCLEESIQNIPNNRSMIVAQ